MALFAPSGSIEHRAFGLLNHVETSKTVSNYYLVIPNYFSCFILIQRVGCDGVLGSDKIEDKCLQCHSPNEDPPTTCLRFISTSTPNQAAMEGE